MGWFHKADERAEHEGYTAGFVERTDHAGIPRELNHWDDGSASSDNVRWVAAACACGWRSPRWETGRPAEWRPSIVLADRFTEDKALGLWKEHVELELARSHRVRALR